MSDPTLERLHAHELECARRYEAFGERFARLETAMSRNTKLLWTIVLGIVGLALQLSLGGIIAP